MVVNEYIVGIFVASLLGIVVLFLLKDGRSKKIAKKVKNDGSVFVTSEEKDRLDNGFKDPDVVIVGAGVAGAALAHTLGKVTVN